MTAWLDNLPYCGTPPAPAELWARWNLDPILLGVLVVLMIWHARRTGVLRPAESNRTFTRTYFIAGWTALALGLISPLCALSVALFSARVTQHMWLVLIAAPLLVLASSPVRKPSAALASKSAYSPIAAGTVFAACLWLWHAPRLYALTFTSDLAYWLMHATLIGSAILLWRSMAGENGLARVGAGFLTFFQMGLLGALLTLAPRTLYAPHLLTAPLWDLSPLQDQQLGGLIMWIPAGFVIVFAALASVLSMLRPPVAVREPGT
jgi:putative membrane protein